MPVGSSRCILDVGTGSGAVAVAAARQDPEFLVTAVDISSEALEVAAAMQSGMKSITNVVCGKRPFFRRLALFDIICSNPPYLTKAEMAQLQPEVSFEPAAALDGGQDGLVFYHRIFQESQPHLAPSAYVAVEIGADQARAVAAIAEGCGFSVEECIQDYGGHDRVVVAKWA